MTDSAETPSDELDDLFARRPGHDAVERERVLQALRKRVVGEHDEPVRLSRYILLERLGSGGSGHVYAAYDPQLDRRVAVKLLKPGRASEPARLIREAKLLARLSHPNVIPVFDAGTYPLRLMGASTDEGEGVFVVMELAGGVDLSKWRRRRAHPWRAIVRVMLEAGRGLAAAHAIGVVHRDFKPANVLVGEDGRARVLDFGLAQDARGDSEQRAATGDGDSDARIEDSLSGPGVVVGTPAYMAPEQHRGAKVDHRADQFGFCASLFEALYDEAAFEPGSLRAMGAEKEAGRIRSRPKGTGVPMSVHRVLLRGLSAEPEDRFPSMTQLLDRLEAAGAGLRRLLVAIAGVTAVSVASVALFAADPLAATEACAEQAARLRGIWDEPAQSRMQASFAAADPDGGAEAWEAVHGRIDDYADAWVNRRRDACAATLAVDSPPEVPAQVFCLERRYAELRGLLTMLADADADLVRGAAEAVAGLVPVARCDETSSFDLAAAGLASAPQSIEIGADLTRADLLYRAGRLDAAMRLLEATVTAAEETGDARLHARSLLDLAMVVRHQQRIDDAEELAYTGLGVAEAGGDQETAIRALVMLMGLHAVDRADHQTAARLRQLAEAKLQRVPSPEIHALFSYNSAILQFEAGQYDEAAASLRQVLELRGEGPPTPQTLHALNLLGGVAQIRGDYEDARQLYDEALQGWLRVVGPSHPTIALMVNNLANLATDEQRYDDALMHHMHALRIREAASGPRSEPVAQTRSNLGGLWLQMGRYGKALEQVEQARAIYESELGPEHPKVARTLQLAAMAHREQGRPEQALGLIDRAQEIRLATLGPEHPDVGSGLSERGWCLLALGRAQEALDHHERARALLDASIGTGSGWVAEAVRGIGAAKLALQRHHEAAANLQRALELQTQARAPRLDLARTRAALARALAPHDPLAAKQQAEAALADYDALEADLAEARELRRFLRAELD